MNLIADSITGNEYSSGLDPPQITSTSILYPFVAKSILQHTTKEPVITLIIKYIDVQRQSEGCDCGLFTIAYVSIIRNLAITLNTARAHLLNCFEQGFITMFSIMKTKWATVQVKVYRKRFMSIVC